MKKHLFALLVIVLIVRVLQGQDVVKAAFTESEMVLPTPTGEIFGTLTMPDGVEKPPVAIIIAGSGPTDRNGNSTMGLMNNAYQMMAHRLAEHGIASLRYDKRGIAASRAAVQNESDLTFDVYIGDVVSWIGLLRFGDRFNGIFVAGHSEGATLGLIASLRTPVNGYISIAGAGRPIDQVLREQLAAQLPPAMLAESNLILDSQKSGHLVEEVNPMLVSLYRPSVQPYLISWLKYNPAEEMAKLKIPVLIVQGTTDLQVGVDDAGRLAEALPDAKLLLIENMNHVLKEAGTDLQQNMGSYYDPERPLKEELVEELVAFIRSVHPLD